jgi:hypothetical protein
MTEDKNEKEEPKKAKLKGTKTELGNLLEDYFGDRARIDLRDLPEGKGTACTVAYAHSRWETHGETKDEAIGEMIAYLKANPQVRRDKRVGRGP